MDSFLNFPDSKKDEYYRVTAKSLKIEPYLIEKDFWVCWTLQELFSLPGIAENLTFKGGTSLSKCFNIIHRFSEDIDITISREYLKHDDEIEPSFDLSPTQNSRRLDRILEASLKAISQEIIPKLCERMSQVLGERGKWDVEISPKDKQSYLFYYPTIYPNMRPSVILEFGAKSNISLVQPAQVLPYVADVFQDSLSLKPAKVKVLSPDRTFWEKAMILHRLHNKIEGKDMPARMARHYYDLYEMEKVGIFEKAIKDSLLMLQAVNSEKLFFKRPGVDYDNIKYSTLRLVPMNSKIIEVLKNDYLSMQGMFFDSPPSFDQILFGLKDMEHRINILEKTLEPVKSAELSVPSTVKAVQIDPQKVSVSLRAGDNSLKCFLQENLNTFDGILKDLLMGKTVSVERAGAARGSVQEIMNRLDQNEQSVGIMKQQMSVRDLTSNTLTLFVQICELIETGQSVSFDLANLARNNIYEAMKLHNLEVPRQKRSL